MLISNNNQLWSCDQRLFESVFALKFKNRTSLPFQYPEVTIYQVPCTIRPPVKVPIRMFQRVSESTNAICWFQLREQTTLVRFWERQLKTVNNQQVWSNQDHNTWRHIEVVRIIPLRNILIFIVHTSKHPCVLLRNSSWTGWVELLQENSTDS